MRRLAALVAFAGSALAFSCLSIDDQKRAAGSGGSAGTTPGKDAGGVESGAWCGKDCGGGECVLGKCQALEIATDPGGFLDLAIDESYVYWVSYMNGVNRVSKTGGDVQHLANGFAPSIALDAEHVYYLDTPQFTTANVEVTTKTPGGTPTMLVKGTDLVGLGVAVSNGWVYWATFNTLYRQNLVGTPAAQSIVKNLGWVSYFTLGASEQLVWIETALDQTQGKIAMLQNGQRMEIASAQNNPYRVVVDGKSIFWTNHGGGVMKAEAGVAGAKPLCPYGGTPTGLAADGTNVYFADDGAGEIRVVPESGGVDTLVIDKQTQPQVLAADAGFIYWASNNGSKLMKLAK